MNKVGFCQKERLFLKMFDEEMMEVFSGNQDKSIIEDLMWNIQTWKQLI